MHHAIISRIIIKCPLECTSPLHISDMSGFPNTDTVCCAQVGDCGWTSGRLLSSSKAIGQSPSLPLSLPLSLSLSLSLALSHSLFLSYPFISLPLSPYPSPSLPLFISLSPFHIATSRYHTPRSLARVRSFSHSAAYLTTLGLA